MRDSKVFAAVAGSAMLCLASIANAGVGGLGFARFSLPTDTIRIVGNTVFPGVDSTYEMVIRIPSGAPFGPVVGEQRDSVEAKYIWVSDTEFEAYMTRGIQCGNVNSTDFPPNITNRWVHLAWVRSGPTASLFVDGELLTSWIDQNPCTGNHPGSWMSLGMHRTGAGYVPGPPIPSFIGDLDWIRISRVARYSGNFTPPCEIDIFPDADTELLLRFNEGPGAKVLVDESPNAWVCEPGVPVHPGVDATAPEFVLGDASGPPPCQDCDSNGIPDAVEIAAGAPDVNANGVPDTCECLADLNTDSIVNGADISVLLGYWGQSGKGVVGDINGDGLVDGADLAILLSSWGTCP
jgi:hypothetical protein